jgi:4-hydroxy-tetrahydrodipicolinate synthase
MSKTTFFCMVATPFTKTGAVDEAAFRQLLARLIDSRLGIYVGSGGSGEGHALRPDELRRIYEIAVEEARGRVPVHANPPEQHTARGTRDQVRIAAEAGIEVVHMYTLAGWHGMKPTDSELLSYFEDVFAEIKCPIALAVNPTMGYTPKASLVAEVCRKYPQIVTIKLTSVPDTYHIELRDALGSEMSFHVTVVNSMVGMMLGADGVFGSESNFIPRTYRRYQELFEAKSFDEMAVVYAQIRRLGQHVTKWGPSNPRWLKMGMKLLKLPGWEGGLREPYRMPGDDELKKYADGLLKLGIPEIDELAAKAGLK